MLLSKNAQKIQDTLEKLGCASKVLELSSETKTAQQAAETIGCEVAQILKSLIFMTKESHLPLLVLASGVNRVDAKKIEQEMGEKILKADADFTKKVTGFTIGGIPPFGHPEKITTFVDKDLFQYEEIWAAAGMPNAVFCLSAKALKELDLGKVIEVK